MKGQQKPDRKATLLLRSKEHLVIYFAIARLYTAEWAGQGVSSRSVQQLMLVVVVW